MDNFIRSFANLTKSVKEHLELHEDPVYFVSSLTLVVVLGLCVLVLFLTLVVVVACMGTAFCTAFCTENLKFLAVVFVLSLLGAPFTIFKVGNQDTQNPLPSNCWRHVIKSWSLKLSASVGISDFISMLDAFTSVNLLSSAVKHELYKEILRELTSVVPEYLRSYIIQRHFLQILNDHLAWTGEQGFVTVCKVLLQRPKYSNMGLEICKSCEVCCVNVLKGNWNHKSNFCAVSTEFGFPVDGYSYGKKDKVMFDIHGGECITWYNIKKVEYQNYFDIIAVRTTTDANVDGISKDSTSFDAYNNSLVCNEQGMVVGMEINAQPEGVDHVKLKESLANVTGVNSSEIRLAIGTKESTAVVLLLPPKAGMEILSIVKNSERQRLLLNVLSSSVCSLSDYVTVLVQISSLPPIKMFFVPKGALSWFYEDDFDFCAKAIRQAMAHGMCIPL